MGKIILQPLTKISTYDDLSRRSNITIIGNIGHLISEDEKIRKSFYKSKVGRKNIEIISELVSELYTYVNKNLSKYSDPESYRFKVYYTIEVDDQTGVILGKPTFEVELYKHIGIISGKSSGIKNETVNIILADVAKIKLAKHFHDGLRLISENVPLVSYKHQEKIHEIPEQLREKMEEDTSYIIIDNYLYKIKLESSGDKYKYLIENNGNQVLLNDQMSVFNFILSKTNMNPEISSTGTVFQAYTDKEVEKIETAINKTKIHTGNSFNDHLEKIKNLDLVIEGNEKRCSKLNERKRMRQELREQLESLNKKYDKIKSLYEENKLNFITNKDVISDLDEKFERNLITHNDYSVTKLKLVMNINQAMMEINNVNNTVVREIIPSYIGLEKKIFK